MSQRVKVQRDLVFDAQAGIDQNVEGDMLPKRMTSIDWFDQTTLDTTNDYTQTLGGDDDAGALVAGGYHGFKGTTGTTDQDVAFLGTALIFDITQNPTIEAQIEITDVSGTFVFFGFADANTETTPASSIDGAGGTLANAAADAAGFVIDGELDTSSIYSASVNTQGAGGTVQNVDSGTDWGDTESHRLRVHLDASGNAYFYLDGVQCGYIALAVADVPLCAVLNYGTRNNDGANYVYMRYLAKFQDNP